MQSQVKTVLFTNFTREDFSWMWDSVSYTFPAGQSVYMEDWKAAHFAKHLVNRELHKMGKEVNDRKREELLAKCISDPSLPVAQSQVDQQLMNQNAPSTTKIAFCEHCDSKGTRHKKECPTLVKEESPDKSPDKSPDEAAFVGA